jgi:hypothetical protein
MKILLNYYHPVSEDLAITFRELGHEVFISINTGVKDHYGDWKILYDLLKEKYNDGSVVTLSQARVMVKTKQVDIVGVDGVFSGDQDLMQICKNVSVPFFCIQGYPLVANEPSYNILSLGWFLPQVQYVSVYKDESEIKTRDWKNIYEIGESDMKNICVFYPNFHQLKKDITNFNNSTNNKKLVSAVQQYEKYNYYSYLLFRDIKKELEKNGITVNNLESQPRMDVLDEISSSTALLHLKFADQPGIAIFEAMLLGKPIVTMKQFVLASFNQEVLIDNYNAIIADDVEELKSRILTTDLVHLGMNAYRHAHMLTSLGRQSGKLEKFLQKSLRSTL